MGTRYKNFDGLKTLATFGIVVFHMFCHYGDLSPFISLLKRLNVFVQLFFIISAFSMCCGYYERVKNNGISLNKFYNKRYLRILPFFALLIFMDVIVQFAGGSTLIEAFANLTLMFGFVSNANISVIGVGWTLGVIFAFYILFPFFVYTIWNKRRAWIWFLITLFFNYACRFYFLANGQADTKNVMMWLCYFYAGGLLYLYRDGIAKIIGKNIWTRLISLALTIGTVAVWIFVPDQIGSVDVFTLKTLLMFSAVVSYAISVKSVVMSNPVTKFLSDISFEIYLSHMFIYRALRLLKLTKLFSNAVLSSCFNVVTVFVLSVIFAFIAKKVLNFVIDFLAKKIKEIKEKRAKEEPEKTENI
ncbi:MAG: acyltransferase [Clostridiales bacterium]|nr:acyltransferase [Clostridiales bacterium]